MSETFWHAAGSVRLDAGEEITGWAKVPATLRQATLEARVRTPWLFLLTLGLACSLGDEAWLLWNTVNRKWRRGEVVAVSDETVTLTFHGG